MICKEMSTLTHEKHNAQKLTTTMKNWDIKSSVRTSDRKYDDFITLEDFNFFRAELVPLLFHPIFYAAPVNTQKILQVLQLSRYLYSTEIMETHVINPSLVALQNLDFIPPEMKVNAWKIYTDEAYHSLMVAEIRKEIHDKTKINLPQLPYPAAQRVVLAEVNKLPQNLRSIGLICVAAVNETLITANLVQARDNSLFPSIRQMLTDHAQDEAVHSLFFSEVFSEVWKNIDDKTKLALYHLIPIAIKNFLGADIQSLTYDIVSLGFDNTSAEKIADEAMSYYLSHAHKFKTSINSTFKMLEKANFLNECDFGVIFEGIDVPKQFINFSTNINRKTNQNQRIKF